MRRRLVPVCVLAALVAGCNLVGGGCALLDGVIRIFEPNPAGRVGERTILVLPFAPLDVRVEHPDLEREAAAALLTHMKQFLPRATFVSVETLRDWQADHPDWRGMLTLEIGQALGADLVIEVHIAMFRTREQPGSMVLQGALAWEARAVDVAGQKQVWRMGRAEIRWPREPRHVVGDISEERVKARTLTLFAEQFTIRFLQEFEG